MSIGKQQTVVDAEFATRLFEEAKKRGVVGAVGFRQVPRTVGGLKELAGDCRETGKKLKDVVNKMPEGRRVEARNIVSGCGTFAEALMQLAAGNRQYAKKEYNI